MDRSPSPERFLETATAYQRTAALKGAIELDLFTAIGKESATALTLAERRRASERGVRILCDYLTILGFLVKDADRYALTPDSAAFLDRGSPAYLGGTLEFLASPVLAQGFASVAAAVRRGGTVISDGGTVAPEHPIWISFARAMAPMASATAQVLPSVVRVEPGRPPRSSTSPPATVSTASSSRAATLRPRSSRSTGRACWRWPGRTPAWPA